MAGLPGTGKTYLANKLATYLKYSLIGQNIIRRKFMMKKMQNQNKVLREIDKRLAFIINSGKGVIFDSVNKYSFRRQQVYGIASSCGVNAILLECTCSEEEAKKRMKKRPGNDGLVSDPNNTKVYDKLARQWQNIKKDFTLGGINHVSHLRYDSEQKKFEKVVVNNNSKNLNSFIEKIEKILTNQEKT